LNKIALQAVVELFERYKGAKPSSVHHLPPSASERKYFRLNVENDSILGAWNPCIQENEAFFSFTYQFLNKDLPVPPIYAISDDRKAYLLRDLGNVTLFSHLQELRKSMSWNEQLTEIYRQTLDALIRFQLAGKGFDFSKAYPRGCFDEQSILWDLQYFKYYFLKLAGIFFDEQALETDFRSFAEFLTQAPSGYFMYRDFQSRNVMLHDDTLYFIDYQGGREGPCSNDLASLLYDAKADIPHPIREILLRYYIEQMKQADSLDPEEFLSYWPGFVYIRILQALGTYGYRGFFQQKTHFLLSIPYALNNLSYVLENYGFAKQMPELERVVRVIANDQTFRSFGKQTQRLLVQIVSFSYRKGIPLDSSGNGGGFVFDCRALPNPGIYQQFSKFTGNHTEVIEFFDKFPEIKEFIQNCTALIQQSIHSYLEKGYTQLLVCFGCTGGQHRSVYCANALAEKISASNDYDVVLTHRELSFDKAIFMDE